MSEKVQINCKTDDGQAYRIMLKVHHIEPFIAASNSSDMISSNGEELAAKLLAANRGNIFQLERQTLEGQCNDSPDGRVAQTKFNEDGVVIQEVRYRGGMKNDSENGDPALKAYNENGILMLVEHYRDDVYNDGINGEPATVQYYPDGSLRIVERFRDGLFQDGANGEPALVSYRAKGGLEYVEHFQGGQLHDGINGEPATCKYDEQGKMILAARFSEGEQIKELKPHEIAAYTAYIEKLNPPKNPPSTPRGPSFS